MTCQFEIALPTQVTNSTRTDHTSINSSTNPFPALLPSVPSSLRSAWSSLPGQAVHSRLGGHTHETIQRLFRPPRSNSTMHFHQPHIAAGGKTILLFSAAYLSSPSLSVVHHSNHQLHNITNLSTAMSWLFARNYTPPYTFRAFLSKDNQRH